MGYDFFYYKEPFLYDEEGNIIPGKVTVWANSIDEAIVLKDAKMEEVWAS